MKFICAYKECDFTAHDVQDGGIFCLESWFLKEGMKMSNDETFHIYLCPKHHKTLMAIIGSRIKEEQNGKQV